MVQAISETQPTLKVRGESALRGEVDLEVRCGEIFGFPGPNGAGKTGTLILGLLEPSAGKGELVRPGHPRSTERAAAPRAGRRDGCARWPHHPGRAGVRPHRCDSQGKLVAQGAVRGLEARAVVGRPVQAGLMSSEVAPLESGLKELFLFTGGGR